MKPLGWFQERELEEVICKLPNGGICPMIVTDPKHSFKMQERGYMFEAKLRVHRAPPAECESCSS
jgi:hypothetical protein